MRESLQRRFNGNLWMVKLTVLIVLLAVAAGLIFDAASQMLLDQRIFSVTEIKPLEESLCPGDTFHYDVTIEMKATRGIGKIAEMFCRLEEPEICFEHYADAHDVPLAGDRIITSFEASRVLTPTFLFRPGQSYELWHCIEGKTFDACYTVGPLNISEECE